MYFLYRYDHDGSATLPPPPVARSVLFNSVQKHKSGFVIEDDANLNGNFAMFLVDILANIF